MKPFLLAFLGSGVAAATLFSAQNAVVPLNEFVAVSSTAAPDYQRTRGDGSLRPETYTFAEGKLWEGSTVDRGLEKFGLNPLLLALAQNLARQSYYPIKDPAKADLLIVVHYGMSEVFEDPNRVDKVSALHQELVAVQAAAARDGMADPSRLNEIVSDLEWGQEGADRAMVRNARLLGYSRTLARLNKGDGVISTEESKLRAELAEERYFIVLMAYDYQLMLKEKKTKLLWVTRLSVGSRGNNFRESVPVLGQAGSHVFGRQLDGLVHVKANMPNAVIDIGPLETLGAVESAAAPSK